MFVFEVKSRRRHVQLRERFGDILGFMQMIWQWISILIRNYQIKMIENSSASMYFKIKTESEGIYIQS